MNKSLIVLIGIGVLFSAVMVYALTPQQEFGLKYFGMVSLNQTEY